VIVGTCGYPHGAIASGSNAWSASGTGQKTSVAG